MEPKDDEDDDVSFAKWMSSFWGHNWIEENERGIRDRRGSQDTLSRKTSLPCPFPMFPRITPSNSQPRRHSDEDQGSSCRTHIRDYRKCSGERSLKESLESKGRSHSINQAFSESSKQPVHFRAKRSVSLGHESQKERRERECLSREIRLCKKTEENFKKEEGGEACITPLFEKGPK